MRSSMEPKKKVLLIDDDNDHSLLLETILEPEYEIRAARDGVEAIQLLQHWVPDMFICDIKMPVMDGLSFRKAVRLQPLYELVPFIFLTARTELEDKLAGLDLGVDDYITKPFIPQELMARVRVTLQKYHRFKQLACYDSLTGLLNRREMTNYLEFEINRFHRYQRAFSILLLDLDHFKAINDTYGHNVGDRVLQAVARQLEVSKRNSDRICRWGGEEFLLLLPETDHVGCKNVGRRVLDTFLCSRLLEEKIVVTFSGGMATIPDDGITINELLSSADKALYRAKSQGRSQILSL